jgi:hypothetical protein
LVPPYHFGMAEQNNDVTPLCLSFFICDRVIKDAMSGQQSVIGIVTQVHTTKFPAVSPPVWIWAELTSGHGQTPLSIEIVDCDEKRDPVMRAEAVVDFGDPLAISQMALQLPSLVFPEPGDYRLRLISKGAYVAERRLLLHLVQPPAA